MSAIESQDRFVLSRGDVSRQLGISPERVRQLTKDGTLLSRATRLGRLYDAISVEAYALTREQRRQASRS